MADNLVKIRTIQLVPTTKSASLSQGSRHRGQRAALADKLLIEAEASEAQAKRGRSLKWPASMSH